MEYNFLEAYGNSMIDRFDELGAEKQYYAFLAVVLNFVLDDYIDDQSKAGILRIINIGVEFAEQVTDERLSLYREQKNGY